MYFPKYFKGLFDFGYQRRGLEVPTFYFVYLIGSVMVGAVVGMLVSSATGSDAIRISWRVDSIAASILFLVMSHSIILKKGLGNEIKLVWLLPMLAALLTIFLGHIIGLLILTILATRPNKYTQSNTSPSQDPTKQNAQPEPQTDPQQQAS